MLIELKGITKVYSSGKIGFTALKDLSLSIEKGEFIGIIGHSGSGKSTLMNIIGCLDRPTLGKYLLEGEDISQKNDKELAYIRNKKLGFVFQTFNLLPRTNTVENVLLPLCYAGIPRKERRKMACRVLERVGLSTKLKNMPQELSSGEQQRVAIARALVNNPDIICADEPTGNLDTTTSYGIMEILSQLNKDGKTIILITHEQDIASYAKRIIKLRDGEIECKCL